MNNQTEEQWRLRVAKAEAWDEGYYAARQDWINGTKEATPNPYDRMANDRTTL